MTNAARVGYPNTTYHVMARGNRRNDIFKDDEDFQVYLEILQYFKNDCCIELYRKFVEDTILKDSKLSPRIMSKDRDIIYE